MVGVGAAAGPERAAVTVRAAVLAMAAETEEAMAVERHPEPSPDTRPKRCSC
jgi:hypothetical protein